jgi:hypothetical protein
VQIERFRQDEVRPGELSAGSFGCGNDFVEARVTAQIIPARIETEIAVGRTARNRRDNFELLQRTVALACPRVDQRQIGNPGWSVERILGNRLKIDRAKCLADRLFFSAKPRIKFRNVRKVRCVLGIVA